MISVSTIGSWHAIWNWYPLKYPLWKSDAALSKRPKWSPKSNLNQKNISQIVHSQKKKTGSRSSVRTGARFEVADFRLTSARLDLAQQQAETFVFHLHIVQILFEPADAFTQSILSTS